MSEPQPPARRRLLTVLGVTFGIAVTVGNTIGAGILREPGTIAAHFPEFWPYLAIWIAGALYALLGTNALAELATVVPRSGGQYVFVRKALGDYAGFIVGWSDWLSTAGTAAVISILIGEYAVGLVPELRSQVVVALLVVAVLTILQWIGVRSGGVTQTITSALKAVALMALVVACFVLGTQHPTHPAMQIERDMPLMAALVLSLQAVIYTFDGWSAPLYFTEEIRDYRRSVPRAMFGGLAAVTAIYILINIAFSIAVPLPTLAGKNLAAATVAEHLFGGAAETVLRVIVVVTLVSAVNACVLMAPRVLFAMSSDGLFWRGATEVNKGGTPDIALLITSIAAATFIVTGTFNSVVAKLAFFFVANYTLSFVSLFILRRREPAAERPYRAWGHPVTTAIALVASVLFLVLAVAQDPKNSLYALGLLAVSLPLFALVKWRGHVAAVEE